MRTALSVAKRALALELLWQRIVLEHQSAELAPEDANDAYQGLLYAVQELGLADAFATFFAGDEMSLLRAPLGELPEDAPIFDLAGADLSLVLWCLGRVPQLYTVAQLRDGAVTEVMEAGFLARSNGDLEAAAAELREASLRDADEIEAHLGDVARANALLATAEPDSGAGTVPPISAFYILPWILSESHPWGVPCELRAGPELGGMIFAMGGVRVPDPEN
jgi:hypothetical protein